MARIDDLLRAMIEHGASDLHMTSGFKPFLRTHGDMASLQEGETLTAESNRELITEIMPAANRDEFDKRLDTDFAYALSGVGRFRVNVFMDRFGIGAVLRAITTRIPTADELGLPQVVRDLCKLPKGLVVVTGPTGSGKSTTLAAMIDLINKTRADHIITIEDPIEFVYTPDKCLINQREIRAHTQSFANALRAALREDPNIVLVGEMRDLETTEIAIETAETGHLVFGTLHTTTAATTVNRIIDKFPANRQNQIRSMLADSLKGVIAQTLCKRIPKGRVAAMELLIVTPGVAGNIRDGKTHQIQSAMQTGRSLGMQTHNDALVKLVVDGVVAADEAYSKSVDREGLVKKLQDSGVVFSPRGPGVTQTSATAGIVQPSAFALHAKDVVATCLADLRRDPEDTKALNNLAWILATSADPELRNAAQAVQAAEKAYAITRGKDPAVLDTLGAAYAESGAYDKAIDWAKKAMRMARESNQQNLVKTLEERIALYESGLPLRQRAPSGQEVAP